MDAAQQHAGCPKVHWTESLGRLSCCSHGLHRAARRAQQPAKVPTDRLGSHDLSRMRSIRVPLFKGFGFEVPHHLESPALAREAARGEPGDHGLSHIWPSLRRRFFTKVKSTKRRAPPISALYFSCLGFSRKLTPVPLPVPPKSATKSPVHRPSQTAVFSASKMGARCVWGTPHSSASATLTPFPLIRSPSAFAAPKPQTPSPKP